MEIKIASQMKEEAIAGKEATEKALRDATESYINLYILPGIQKAADAGKFRYSFTVREQIDWSYTQQLFRDAGYYFKFSTKHIPYDSTYTKLLTVNEYTVEISWE
jgi:hypothetical protein